MKGRLTISRIQSNRAESFIRINIEDESSGLCIVDARMSMEDLTKALTGCASTPVDIERCCNLWPENIGKEAETMRVMLPLDRCPKPTADQILNSFADTGLSEDGWFIFHDGRSSQQSNQDGWEIILRRYVDKGES